MGKCLEPVSLEHGKPKTRFEKLRCQVVCSPWEVKQKCYGGKRQRATHQAPLRTALRVGAGCRGSSPNDRESKSYREEEVGHDRIGITAVVVGVS